MFVNEMAEFLTAVRMVNSVQIYSFTVESSVLDLVKFIGVNYAEIWRFKL